ncbi:FAD-dependent oxidoreductase [Metallumcola ferriviriculae]|uniref:FAD-dependent oxidoreductase n=1 Tax=Metallumcola ferriviriculae TaxID=3039180 RepID=A0AAU0UPM8_9FIRM|nr:FAD-dependent oxidoreductase [Desulfitibacteraceae bacterium MK1]
MAKIKIIIDGQEYLEESGSILLEAARKNGIPIPSLCHDPRLEPFGACRQCLVEVEGAKGPVQACGLRITEGMVIRTNTEKVKRLRKLCLEMMLSEHYGDCIAPCQLACPAGIDIQGFVAHIANGNPEEAAALIKEKLPLPASVGRVCPRFCEEECRRNLVDQPVAICTLKRYAGDCELGKDAAITSPALAPDTGKRVAVVGGGPAGLSAAYYLALKGHRISIFDASTQLGGMMRYGIPEYRLPKAALDYEIEAITCLCEKVFNNKKLGRDFTVGQLKQMGFDAVFVSIGSWSNQELGLENEALTGIYSGIDFLRQVGARMDTHIGDQVVVIGGGNTAMDAARTALRLGAAKVTVVYRRSREEMPASAHEISQAEEEGVKFSLLTGPVAFTGDQGSIETVSCIKMRLAEPDSSGRRRPVPIKGSEYDIPVDTLIAATGQKLNVSDVTTSNEIILSSRGRIKANSNTMQTDTQWLFAGGDCVTGPATVVEAVSAGRKAALGINQYLAGEIIRPEAEPFNCSRGNLADIDTAEFEQHPRIPRTAMPTCVPKERKRNFKEFELGYSKEMAEREAGRCLSCGCLDTFSCRLRQYAAEQRVDIKKLGFGKRAYPVYLDHPFIIRDPNKCILCGNCVRICEEVQEVGALGFVGRGSETVVLPALKNPLMETLCQSCGQCLNVCPTGALTGKSILPKPGPWNYRKAASVCNYCNIGCRLEVRTAGNRIIGVTSPVAADTPNEGNLCMNGTFGYTDIKMSDRMTQPLIINGIPKEVNWETALAAAASLLNDVWGKEGLDSIGVAVSPKLTNEELYLAYKLGRMGLGTQRIFSTVPVISPLMDANIHCPSFQNLSDSDLIVLVNGEIFTKYPVVGHKIKKAVANGSKLVIISPYATNFDIIACLTLKSSSRNTSDLLKVIIHYLRSSQGNSQQCLENEFDSSSNSNVHTTRHRLQELTRLLTEAVKPVIIADGDTVSPETMALLQRLFSLSGSGTKSYNGLMPLYPQGNIAGQWKIGINTHPGDYRQQLADLKVGRIKGLLVINDGAELNPELFQPNVKTVLITPAKPRNLQVDVVLPGTLIMETTGSITNVEGKIQLVSPAVSPKGGKETRQVIAELARGLGTSIGSVDPAAVHKEILDRFLK